MRFCWGRGSVDFALCWLMFRIFSQFFRFLTHLKLSCVFVWIFSDFFLRFLGVWGGFWEGFWEVFSMNFGMSFETRDFVKIELPPRREHDF